MLAKSVALGFLLALGGCAGLPDWSLFAPAGERPSAADAMAGEFDFGWRLSGDPDVAPLQVFDNGRRMWLQFASGQAVPAIFARRTSGGDLLLDYRREGVYVVLEQVWPTLLLRGGRQQSRVDRLSSTPQRPDHAAVPKTDAAVPAVEPPMPAPEPALAMPVSATEPARPQQREIVAPVRAATQPSADTAAAALGASLESTVLPLENVAFAAAITDSPPVVPAPAAIAARYEVSPRDQNMRLALSRWAVLAGWTFEPEHWTVDADIPIAGTAQFEAGFKQAVQALMASTELADRPLQPCFYSNKVLRIVPYAQACNRVTSLAGES